MSEDNQFEMCLIQPWDFIVANNLGFLEGSVIKQLVEYHLDQKLSHLTVAQSYIQKLIEKHKQNDILRHNSEVTARGTVRPETDQG